MNNPFTSNSKSGHGFHSVGIMTKEGDGQLIGRGILVFLLKSNPNSCDANGEDINENVFAVISVCDRRGAV